MEWSFYIDIAHNKNSDKIKYYRYMCDNSAAFIDTNSRIQANKNIPINACHIHNGNQPSTHNAQHMLTILFGGDKMILPFERCVNFYTFYGM